MEEKEINAVFIKVKNEASMIDLFEKWLVEYAANREKRGVHLCRLKVGQSMGSNCLAGTIQRTGHTLIFQKSAYDLCESRCWMSSLKTIFAQKYFLVFQAYGRRGSTNDNSSLRMLLAAQSYADDRIQSLTQPWSSLGYCHQSILSQPYLLHKAAGRVLVVRRIICAALEKATQVECFYPWG